MKRQEQDKPDPAGTAPEAEKSERQEKERAPFPIDRDDLDLENISYFGYTERPFFQRLSLRRAEMFRPLLALLAGLGIKSNHLTSFSFITLLVGFPVFFKLKLYFWAFAVLGFHIFLDGLDGPLARYRGKQSPSGALLDMANDVSGMVVVVITAAHFKFIHPTIAFLYVVAYLYLTFVAVAQNVLKIPYRFVMKTKYPVYALLAIRAATGADITTWFCVVAIAYMITHIVVATENIMFGLDRGKNNKK